jgi:hypothetical protein
MKRGMTLIYSSLKFQICLAVFYHYLHIGCIYWLSKTNKLKLTTKLIFWKLLSLFCQCWLNSIYVLYGTMDPGHVCFFNDSSSIHASFLQKSLCGTATNALSLLPTAKTFLAMKSNVKVKGIMSKLTIKFWMCQKCCKMKDYKKNQSYKCCSVIKHTLDRIIIIKYKSRYLLLRLLDWLVLNSVHSIR